MRPGPASALRYYFQYYYSVVGYLGTYQVLLYLLTTSNLRGLSEVNYESAAFPS